MKFKNWIKKNTKDFTSVTWRSIGKLGNNKLVQKSYIYLIVVPIAAKLLSRIKSPVKMNVGGFNFEFVIDLPFNWKILFFAALCFTIGSIIYSLFAPLIIRENSSFGDFKSHNKDFNHLVSYLEDMQLQTPLANTFSSGTYLTENKPGPLISYLKEAREKVASNAIVGGARKYSVEVGIIEDWINHLNGDSAALQGSFWRIHIYANQIFRPNLAMACRILFFIGFILLFAIIAQGTWEVIKML